MENVLERTDVGNVVWFQHCLGNCLVEHASVLFLESTSFLYSPSSVILSFVTSANTALQQHCSLLQCVCASSTLGPLEFHGVNGDGARALPSPQTELHPDAASWETQPTQSPPPHADASPKPSWYLTHSSAFCPPTWPWLPINSSCKKERGSCFNAASSQRCSAATHFWQV